MKMSTWLLKSSVLAERITNQKVYYGDARLIVLYFD